MKKVIVYLFDLVIFLLAINIVHELINLFKAYWNIHNSYEITILYFIYIFPSTLIALGFSIYSYVHNLGFQKKIAIIGLFIAGVSILSFFTLFINARING